MSQKNETPVLIVALLLTVGVAGGLLWWITRRNPNLSGLLKPSSSPTATPTPGSAGSPSVPSSPSTNPPPQPGQSATFAEVQSVPSGLFNYGGSTSWAPIRLRVDPAIQTARSELRLRYVDPIGRPPSSGAGITMVLDGKLAFSQSSRPIKDAEYQQAKQRGFALKEVAVAIDGLAVAVNPGLNISGLTLDQLKAIYTGKVTNWSQVGGPSLSIVPYSRPINSGGTVELFVEDILGGQSFGSGVKFVSTTTEALRALANNPGGIYYASAPEVVPQCTIKPIAVGRRADTLVLPYQAPLVSTVECQGQGKRNQLNINSFQKGDYPITRNLLVVVKQNNGSEQQAGEAYANLLLSAQGQELVNQAGFVRIR